MTGLRSLRSPHIAAAIIYIIAASVFVVQMGGMNLRSLLIPLICTGIMVAGALSSFRFGDLTVGELTTNKKEIVTLSATAAYVGLIFVFGFYIASFVYVVFIFVLVSGFTVRMAILGIINAAGIVATVFVLFNLFLDYFVPEGLLAEYLL